MNLKYTFFKLFFCVLFCLPLSLLAQDSLSEIIEDEPVILDETIEGDENLGEEIATVQHVPPPPSKPVAMRNIPENQWKKAGENLDYSSDRPEPIKPQKPTESKPTNTNNWNPDWKFWGDFGQIFAIIIAIIALGFGIYKFSEQPTNRQIASDGTVITFENVEEYLHESDLDRFLREAKAANNYQVAVRLYFLKIIRELSERGQITWSKEKTNRDYLREMRPNPQHRDFRNVVNSFEKTWYGLAQLDETAFLQIENQMQQFLEFGIKK